MKPSERLNIRLRGEAIIDVIGQILDEQEDRLIKIEEYAMLLSSEVDNKLTRETDNKLARDIYVGGQRDI